MKFCTSFLSAALFCLMVSNGQAQTIDVAKITCEQFRGYKITNPNNIALWLSGYYNGKKNNTVVDVQQFQGALEKLKDYCITHSSETMTQAVDALMSKGK